MSAMSLPSTPGQMVSRFDIIAQPRKRENEGSLEHTGDFATTQMQLRHAVASERCHHKQVPVLRCQFMSQDHNINPYPKSAIVQRKFIFAGSLFLPKGYFRLL
jgi:hypothetical protein